MELIVSLTTLELLGLLLGIIVSLIAIDRSVLSIVKRRRKQRRTYEQNIEELPRLLRLFNINEIKCLQQAGIVPSGTELEIAYLETLVRDHDDAILKACPGSYTVIHEILAIAESIRKYKRLFPF